MVLFKYKRVRYIQGYKTIMLRHTFLIKILLQGMQFFRFLFISRSWNVDRDYLRHQLEYFAKEGRPLWLVIFPEGTNLSHNTRNKSLEYAKKEKMKHPEHCLLPRITGLNHCMTVLDDSIDTLLRPDNCL